MTPQGLPVLAGLVDEDHIRGDPRRDEIDRSQPARQTGRPSVIFSESLDVMGLQSQLVRGPRQRIDSIDRLNPSRDRVFETEQPGDRIVGIVGVDRSALIDPSSSTVIG